jgi:hypothetical protein
MISGAETSALYYRGLSELAFTDQQDFQIDIDRHNIFLPK